MNGPNDRELRMEDLLPDLHRIQDLIDQSESMASPQLKLGEAIAEALRLLSRNLEALSNNDPLWEYISTHALDSGRQEGSTTKVINRLSRQGLTGFDLDRLV